VKAIKVDTNCNVSVVEVRGGVYDAMREYLNGYPERVRPYGLPHPYCMMVDEEGRLKNLPLNPVGSYLYGTHNHRAPIVGDIYLLIEPQRGEISPLTDADIKKLSFVTDIAQTLKEEISE
jgi:hypothetical protein